MYVKELAGMFPIRRERAVRMVAPIKAKCLKNAGAVMRLPTQRKALPCRQ
jgi:hypothetical protein